MFLSHWTEEHQDQTKALGSPLGVSTPRCTPHPTCNRCQATSTEWETEGVGEAHHGISLEVRIREAGRIHLHGTHGDRYIRGQIFLERNYWIAGPPCPLDQVFYWTGQYPIELVKFPHDQNIFYCTGKFSTWKNIFFTWLVYFILDLKCINVTAHLTIPQWSKQNKNKLLVHAWFAVQRGNCHLILCLRFPTLRFNDWISTTDYWLDTILSHTLRFYNKYTSVCVLVRFEKNVRWPLLNCSSDFWNIFEEK